MKSLFEKMEKTVARRRMAAVSRLLLLAVVAACSDSTGPDVVASLEITPGAALSLNVGDVVSLSTELVTRRGMTLTDRTPEWSTSASGVAEVDQKGRVTAVGVGSAFVIASIEGVSDSVTVEVKRVHIDSGCGSSSGWSVGEVRLLAPDATGNICVGGSPTGANYMLVLTSTAASGSLSLRATPSGLSGFASAASATADASMAGQDLEQDWGVEGTIRARERAALPGRVAAARAAADRSPGGARLSITSGVPAVGSLMRLNVSTEACTKPDERVGRVMAVSQTAVIVADTANPRNGFTDTEFRHIGATMDSLVVPVVEDAFGAPADIDSNDRVVVFYTRAVNEMSERGGDSYVGGFFYARDLFPATGKDSCAGSNVGEIMYMLAADPSGQVNGNVRSKEFVQEATIATAAHELQHLINASRRLYILETDNFDEEVWLNEGLSHIAEELVFYRAAGLAPGQDLTASAIRLTPRRREAFNRYASSNFGRLIDYLREPDATSPFASNDELATRGATWSFLRYVADRLGGDQEALWYALANSRQRGLANLRTVLGRDPYPLLRDWAVATYADDMSFSVTSDFTQPSWDLRSIYSGFTGMGGSYPLQTGVLTNSGTSVRLSAGGAAYLAMAVSSTDGARVQLLAAGVVPPPTLTVAAVRTR